MSELTCGPCDQEAPVEEPKVPESYREAWAAEGISAGEGAEGDSRWGGRLRGLGTNLATEKTIACTGAALLAFLMQRAAADVDPAAVQDCKNMVEYWGAEIWCHIASGSYVDENSKKPYGMDRSARVICSHLKMVATDRYMSAAIFNPVTSTGYCNRDGNTHPLIVYDPSDAAMEQRAQLAFGEIMDVAVGLGGTITGEHGVGRLKRPWLAGQLGPEAMEQPLPPGLPRQGLPR